MSPPRGLATVQVDMDPLYLAFPGVPRFAFERQEASIHADVLPVYLELFRDHGVKATFFVVGRDLTSPMGRAGVERILAEGHEVANHTFTHERFNGADAAAKIEDIDRFEEIFASTFPGVPLSGFKAPCYALDEAVLARLEGRYAYDSSMISVLAAPLLRLYYRRKGQYVHPFNWGRPSHFFAPRTPYRCDPARIAAKGSSKIVMLPVTTGPLLGLPMHFSFVNIFGLGYFMANFKPLDMSSPGYCNFAFHAVDLFDAPECVGRPGLARPLPERVANARRIIAALLSRYEVLPSRELAGRAASGGRA
jgi:hypothetical protein